MTQNAARRSLPPGPLINYYNAARNFAVAVRSFRINHIETSGGLTAQPSLKQHRQLKQEKNHFNFPNLNSNRLIRQKTKQFMKHYLTGLKVEGRWEEEVGLVVGRLADV